MTQTSQRSSIIAKRVFKRLRFYGVLVTVVSATNSFSENALRVLPLTPALTEWAAELVGMDPIVGVTEHSDFPKGIEKKTKVGPYHRINFEIAMSLKPTLVLASRDGNSKDQIEQFRSKNVPVVVADSSSLDEIFKGMKDVASALGQAKLGDQKLKPLFGRVEKMRTDSASSQRPRTKILLQVSSDPLIVVGRKTYLNDLVSLLGYQNVVEASDTTYPRLSIESVLAKDPEVILILAMKDDPKLNERMKLGWSRFPRLKAVQNKRVLILQNDELMRPGLRLVEGIDVLAQTLAVKK